MPAPLASGVDETGMAHSVRMVRRGAEAGWPVVPAADRLDPSQIEAVRARGPVVRVFGAPGTGKTTVAVHTVAHRIQAGLATAPECLVVTSSRVTAAKAREAVTGLFGGTTTEPLAASMQAFGFSILARRAARAGAGVEAPRLLAGAEQDVILADLLAGHRDDPTTAPKWPAEVADALSTRGFRGELRDLLMRAVEYGVSPDELRDLAGQLDEPAWSAAADVLREYDEVTALSRPGAFDPSWVLGAAAGVLLDDEEEFAALARSLKVLVVDDAQELTAAAAALLGVVAEAGVEIVLIGDPDAATQTFRGADPRLFGSGWEGFDMPEPYVLSTRWRQSGDIAALTAAVSRAIGVVGSARHRDALPAPRDAEEESPSAGIGGVEDAFGAVSVQTLVAGDVTAESAHIAALLRRAHLLEGRPWSDMAVIVRGANRTASLRRVLAAAGVPVDVAGAKVPLRDEAAVRPLLTLFETTLAHAAALSRPEATVEPEDRDQFEHIDAVDVDDLLASPLLGSDTVAARRARRELARVERAAGGSRRGPELTAAAVLGAHAEASDPLVDSVEGSAASSSPELNAVRSLRRVLRAGVAAARLVTRRDRVVWAPGVTCESVLWALWQATGVQEPWRARALSGGPASARADRDLDAVLALFDAARAYVDRLPHRGPDGFLEHVLSQEVAADSLTMRGQRGDQVALTTPQGAAGREWGLVVVAGLQEGVWPDSRLRGSMLGSERLVDAVTGRGTSVRAQLVDVLHDEARLFVSAVGRARHRLVCTAVSSDDEQPSPYLALVQALSPGSVGEGPDDEAHGEESGVDPVPRAMSMTGLVGELRRRLATTRDPEQRRRHVERLAALAAAGVPGADPASWWSLRRPSSDAQVRPDDAPVRVSPSRVETFAQCPLRWFLSTSGGESGHPHTASAVGTLVHDIAAQFEGDLPAMLVALEERWPELELTGGWTERRQWEQAVAMIERLVRYTEWAGGQGWRVAAKEIDMRATIGRADIRGRVDRLESDPEGRLRIIDLKTGGSKPSKGEIAEHPQLGVYQAAVEAGGLAGASFASQSGDPVSGGAALVQIGRAGGVKFDMQAQRALRDDENPSWAADLVIQTANGMARSEFAARQGTWCRTCASRRSCPAKPEGGAL